MTCPLFSRTTMHPRAALQHIYAELCAELFRSASSFAFIASTRSIHAHFLFVRQISTRIATSPFISLTMMALISLMAALRS